MSDSIRPRGTQFACGLGSIVSAMGCGACLAAIASFGGAIGLGFLGQYEGLFVTVLLPLFAALALLANGLGWLSHRQWQRSVLGMIGPLVVLVATFSMAEKLLYVGLAAMVGVSIRDFVSPASRRCGPDGCELPAMGSWRAKAPIVRPSPDSKTSHDSVANHRHDL